MDLFCSVEKWLFSRFPFKSCQMNVFANCFSWLPLAFFFLLVNDSFYKWHSDSKITISFCITKWKALIRKVDCKQCLKSVIQKVFLNPFHYHFHCLRNVTSVAEHVACFPVANCRVALRVDSFPDREDSVLLTGVNFIMWIQAVTEYMIHDVKLVHPLFV